MTTKTSQKTEDMLDQTFQNFDSEQTMNTQTSSGGSPIKPSSSSNIKLIIALGVGCVGIAGYIMFIRPQMAANDIKASSGIQPAQIAQVAPPPPVVQPPVQQPEPAPAPVVVPPVEVNNNQQVAQVQQPEVQPSVNINAQIPEQNNAPQVQVQVPNATVDIKPQQVVDQSQQPVINQQGQVNITPTNNGVVDVSVAQNNKTPQVDVKVEVPNQTANLVVDDIVAKFDKLEKQNTEFKNIVTDIDGRLTTIQNGLTEQKDFNQKVESRLEALETKPATSNVKANKEAAKNVEAKKSETKKVVTKAKSEKTEVVIKEKDVTEKITIKAKQPQKVDIHSVYGGRVWIKNGDGSLSTYSAGDKLPNGEIIKVVDDENLEIVTDVRVIKN